MTKDQAFQLRDMSRKLLRQQPENGVGQSDWRNFKHRRIAFVSGKGGVGKSVLSIQFAAAIAGSGKSVLVVDANPYSPSLNVLTNIHAEFSVQDLLNKEESGQLVFPEIAPNLSLLPSAAPTSQKTYMASSNAAYFLEALSPYAKRFDCVILDTHTGFDDWNVAIMGASDDVFLVTLTEPASIIDTYTFAKSALQHIPGEKFQLLINQVLNQQSGYEAHEKLNLALQHFLSYQISLLGMVPFDMGLKSAVDNQAPFWDKSGEITTRKYVQDIVKQYFTGILNLEVKTTTSEMSL